MKNIGKWLNTQSGNGLQCGKCHELISQKKNFCPNCGRKMYISDIEKAKEIGSQEAKKLGIVGTVVGDEDDYGYSVYVISEFAPKHMVYVRLDIDFEVLGTIKYKLVKE